MQQSTSDSCNGLLSGHWYPQCSVFTSTRITSLFNALCLHVRYSQLTRSACQGLTRRLSWHTEMTERTASILSTFSALSSCNSFPMDLRRSFRSQILAVLSLGLAAHSAPPGFPSSGNGLWFRTQGSAWSKEWLPIGNGYLAGNIPFPCKHLLSETHYVRSYDPWWYRPRGDTAEY